MSVLVVGGLALIGGLAAACFTKAFGIVFLGEPRTAEAARAHEAGAAMRWPMVVLAGLCVLDRADGAALAAGAAAGGGRTHAGEHESRPRRQARARPSDH